MKRIHVTHRQALRVTPKLLAPRATAARKGDCGRVAVVGGSLVYTGAPFYAAAAALHVGADLVHVWTPTQAGVDTLRALSPALCVHRRAEETGPRALSIADWVDRVDSVCIGPGLSMRDE